MRKCRYAAPIGSVSLVMSLLVVACTPIFRSEADVPQVKIVAPANYSTAVRGGTVQIRAVIDEPQGIASVQLRVDSQSVETSLPPRPPVTQLTQDFYWTPAAVGPHEIVVVAQNNSGELGQSPPTTIYVVEQVANQTVSAAILATATRDPFAVGTPLPTAPYTPPPPFTPTPTPTVYVPCSDSSTFVSDVTIPDGTPIESGKTFDKTWRLRNDGTCTWDTRYQFVFLGGSQLGGQSPTSLTQSVAPGGTVDITVHMVAPDNTGTYRSEWQMRNPGGQNFGVVVHALIQVVPSSSALPVITRFDVTPSTITEGQSATLRWEYSNATSAQLYPLGMAVGPSGSLVVSPQVTTEYRLVVYNSAGSLERIVILTVQPAPSSTLPSPPNNLRFTAVRANGFDLAWTDTSNNEQGFRLYNADAQQVVMTYSPNSVSGVISGLACGTPYRFYLVAFNQRGESPPSNAVQAMTLACGG